MTSLDDLHPGQKVMIRIHGKPDFEATFMNWTADGLVAWVICGSGFEPFLRINIVQVQAGFKPVLNPAEMVN